MSLIHQHRLGATALAWLMVILIVSACSGSGQSRRAEQLEQQQQTEHAADVYTELAMGYMEKGQFQVALEKIDLALERNPESPEANTVAAVLNEQVGRLDLAELHYKRAVDINPRDGRMQNNYGQFLCNHGRTQDSIDHFKLAVEDPFYNTPAVAFTNMGACLEKLQQNEAAETSYRAALELDDTFPDALFRLSRVMCNQEKFFNARAFLQRYHSVAAKTSDTLYLCYRIEHGMSATASADECRNELVNKYPDSPSARKLSSGQNGSRLCQ